MNTNFNNFINKMRCIVDVYESGENIRTEEDNDYKFLRILHSLFYENINILFENERGLYDIIIERLQDYKLVYFADEEVDEKEKRKRYLGYLLYKEFFFSLKHRISMRDHYAKKIQKAWKKYWYIPHIKVEIEEEINGTIVKKEIEVNRHCLYTYQMYSNKL